MPSFTAPSIPSAFFWRRLQSLMGFWLIIFIIFHLLTNSQAALWIGDDGRGFIHSVNSIHDFPYLYVFELAVLGIPLLVHLLWGIKYLRTAKYNSFGDTGKTPYLPEYPRNHAYTWQRITAWLLIVGIIAHVVHMRFVEYPVSAFKEGKSSYMVRLTMDEGLYTLAPRLGFQLYDHHAIHAMKHEHRHQAAGEKHLPQSLIEDQERQQESHWLKALDARPLKKGEVVAVAPDFGTAELLMVRDTFKMPYMIVLYTLLVLATCYHAFNGLWTFLISWGVTLTQEAQRWMRTLSTVLMIVISALGLSAAWLTYWVNLKH